MNSATYDIAIVVIVVVVWASLVALALRGWRNRGRRQADSIGELPTAPDDLGQRQLGPYTGLYVGSTLAPSWQDRVAVGDFGDRTEPDLHTHPCSDLSIGFSLSREGHPPHSDCDHRQA